MSYSESNFLEETLEAIIESGHKESDVMFIGSKDGKYRLNLEEFKKVANFEYDMGFGTNYIPSDLIVYFNDKSYIVRGEYDGSEWWEYNTPLNYSVKDKSKSYSKLYANNYEDSVAELNKAKK